MSPASRWPTHGREAATPSSEETRPRTSSSTKYGTPSLRAASAATWSADQVVGAEGACHGVHVLRLQPLEVHAQAVVDALELAEQRLGRGVGGVVGAGRDTRRSRWFRMARDRNSVTSRLAPSDQCTSSTTTTTGARRRRGQQAVADRAVQASGAHRRGGRRRLAREEELEHVGVDPAVEVAQHLDPGGERQGASGSVGARATGHRPARRQPGQQLADQAGLADPGLALHQHDGRLAPGRAGSGSRRTASCSVRPTRGDADARATCPWWHRDGTWIQRGRRSDPPWSGRRPCPRARPTPAGVPCRGARTGRARPGGG